MYKSKRLALGVRAAGLHFVIAGSLLVLLGWFGINHWYPPPFKQMAGLCTFIFWLVFVDLVCGPLLTAVLYDRRKSRRELLLDLGFVACIQIGALAYGVYSLAMVRPLALVFEVDRFRVISMADVYAEETGQLPTGFSLWSAAKPRLFGLKGSSSGQELLQSMDLSAGGIEPSQRPSRWQDYNLSVPEILRRSHPITSAETSQPIMTGVSRLGGSLNELRWLPVQGRTGQSWRLLLDAFSGAPFAFFNDQGEVVAWH